YRMTNIEAAIGLAQLEKADWHLGRRRENARWYQEALSGHLLFTLQPEMPWARSAFWMNCVVLDCDFPLSRDAAMAALYERGIETRPFFYPMHTLPMYQFLAEGQDFPVSDSVAARGMNLPSGAGLTRDDVFFVAQTLIELGMQ